MVVSLCITNDSIFVVRPFCGRFLLNLFFQKGRVSVNFVGQFMHLTKLDTLEFLIVFEFQTLFSHLDKLPLRQVGLTSIPTCLETL